MLNDVLQLRERSPSRAQLNLNRLGGVRQGIRVSHPLGIAKVELEGIEPSSVRWLPAALRPFPRLWLLAATLPGELNHKGSPPKLSLGSGVFPFCQRSFPAVHCCFWCQAATIWPRVPLLVAVILYRLTSQAARTRSSVLASLWLPRFWSLSNSGRTTVPPSPNVETDQPLWCSVCL